MVSEKRRGARFAHVSIQQAGICLYQIHHNQPVERIREMRIDIEAQQLSAELQVLLEQYGYALLVRLDVGDERREFLDVPRHPFVEYVFPALNRVRSERAARADQVLQVLGPAVLLQEVDHQLSGVGMVVVADAHGPEEYLVLRILPRVDSDAAPQQQQWRVAALVLGPHKRPAHFQRRIDLLDKGPVIREERGRVEAFDAEIL